MAALLKTLGYSISTLSVLLLGAVSWDAARKHEALFVCLIVGMIASILGMVLRWLSFLQERRDKAQAERRRAFG